MKSILFIPREDLVSEIERLEREMAKVQCYPNMHASLKIQVKTIRSLLDFYSAYANNSGRVRYYVCRHSDNCIRFEDGSWAASGNPEEIKFYSSAGRAEKFGLAGCKDVDSVADGSCSCKGTVYAVYPGQRVGADGTVYVVSPTSNKILR